MTKYCTSWLVADLMILKGFERFTYPRTCRIETATTTCYLQVSLSGLRDIWHLCLAMLGPPERYVAHHIMKYVYTVRMFQYILIQEGNNSYKSAKSEAHIYTYMSMEFMWIKCLCSCATTSPTPEKQIPFRPPFDHQHHLCRWTARTALLRRSFYALLAWRYDSGRCDPRWYDSLILKFIEIPSKSQGYSSSRNHGSGEWVPTRLVSSIRGPFSTSIIMKGRIT